LNLACGKHLVINSLQITSLKIRPVLQKNGGPTENISHFFSRFSGFSEFFPLQAVLYEQQAAIQPLSKKSCQKHYRRFCGFSRMCHNRRVNVEMTGRNDGCAGWMAVKRRQPGLLMKSENPQCLYPSHRSHPSFLHALIKPPGHWPGSNPIKPNQTQSNPIKVKTGFQQGLTGPAGGPNRQFLPLPLPGWTFNPCPP
jgi:hypothetical protein